MKRQFILLKNDGFMIGFVLQQTLQNKSILRAMMNYSVKNLLLSGMVLDMGAGTNPSYYQLMNLKKVKQIVKLDHYSGKADKKIDLENPPSVKTSKFTHVLCFNLLEHLYNPTQALQFAHANLVEQGQLHGFVPFMIRIHPDPHDYFRYTHESLKNMLEETGFNKINIAFIGIGPLTASYNLFYDVMPFFIRPFIVLPLILLDKLIINLSPSKREVFPLGYRFEAHK
jgi:hypothetical protein